MKRLPNLKLEEIFALGYFLLLVVAGIADPSLRTPNSTIELESTQYAIVNVEGMCCEFTSSAVRRELDKVPGVAGMTPDFRHKTVHVALHDNLPPSAKAIWEAIERTPVRPLRLVLNGDAFSKRPLE